LQPSRRWATPPSHARKQKSDGLSPLGKTHAKQIVQKGPSSGKTVSNQQVSVPSGTDSDFKSPSRRHVAKLSKSKELPQLPPSSGNRYDSLSESEEEEEFSTDSGSEEHILSDHSASSATVQNTTSILPTTDQDPIIASGSVISQAFGIASASE